MAWRGLQDVGSVGMTRALREMRGVCGMSGMDITRGSMIGQIVRDGVGVGGECSAWIRLGVWVKQMNIRDSKTVTQNANQLRRMQSFNGWLLYLVSGNKTRKRKKEQVFVAAFFNYDAPIRLMEITVKHECYLSYIHPSAIARPCLVHY